AHMLGVPATERATERTSDAARSRPLGHGLPLEPVPDPTPPPSTFPVPLQDEEPRGATPRS
ncbi:MAG: hypothetical protein RLZZ524_1383, partial [Pseudomonadota bacterium]